MLGVFVVGMAMLGLSIVGTAVLGLSIVERAVLDFLFVGTVKNQRSGPRHANSASPGQGERGSIAGPMRKNVRGGRKGEPTPRRGVGMGFGGLPPEKFNICKISKEKNPIPNKKEGKGRGRAIHSPWSR